MQSLDAQLLSATFERTTSVHAQCADNFDTVFTLHYPGNSSSYDLHDTVIELDNGRSMTGVYIPGIFTGAVSADDDPKITCFFKLGTDAIKVVCFYPNSNAFSTTCDYEDYACISGDCPQAPMDANNPLPPINDLQTIYYPRQSCHCSNSNLCDGAVLKNEAQFRITSANFAERSQFSFSTRDMTNTGGYVFRSFLFGFLSSTTKSIACGFSYIPDGYGIIALCTSGSLEPQDFCTVTYKVPPPDELYSSFESIGCSEEDPKCDPLQCREFFPTSGEAMKFMATFDIVDDYETSGEGDIDQSQRFHQIRVILEGRDAFYGRLDWRTGQAIVTNDDAMCVFDSAMLSSSSVVITLAYCRDAQATCYGYFLSCVDGACMESKTDNSFNQNVLQLIDTCHCDSGCENLPSVLSLYQQRAPEKFSFDLPRNGYGIMMDYNSSTPVFGNGSAIYYSSSGTSYIDRNDLFCTINTASIQPNLEFPRWTLDRGIDTRYAATCLNITSGEQCTADYRRPLRKSAWFPQPSSDTNGDEAQSRYGHAICSELAGSPVLIEIQHESGNAERRAVLTVGGSHMKLNATLNMNDSSITVEHEEGGTNTACILRMSKSNVLRAYCAVLEGGEIVGTCRGIKYHCHYGDCPKDGGPNSDYEFEYPSPPKFPATSTGDFERMFCQSQNPSLCSSFPQSVTVASRRGPDGKLPSRERESQPFSIIVDSTIMANGSYDSDAGTLSVIEDNAVCVGVVTKRENLGGQGVFLSCVIQGLMVQAFYAVDESSSVWAYLGCDEADEHCEPEPCDALFQGGHVLLKLEGTPSSAPTAASITFGPTSGRTTFTGEIHSNNRFFVGTNNGLSIGIRSGKDRIARAGAVSANGICWGARFSCIGGSCPDVSEDEKAVIDNLSGYVTRLSCSCDNCESTYPSEVSVFQQVPQQLGPRGQLQLAEVTISSSSGLNLEGFHYLDAGAAFASDGSSQCIVAPTIGPGDYNATVFCVDDEFQSCMAGYQGGPAPPPQAGQWTRLTCADEDPLCIESTCDSILGNQMVIGPTTDGVEISFASGKKLPVGDIDDTMMVAHNSQTGDACSVSFNGRVARAGCVTGAGSICESKFRCHGGGCADAEYEEIDPETVYSGPMILEECDCASTCFLPEGIETLAGVIRRNKNITTVAIRDSSVNASAVGFGPALTTGTLYTDTGLVVLATANRICSGKFSLDEPDNWWEPYMKRLYMNCINRNTGEGCRAKYKYDNQYSSSLTNGIWSYVGCHLNDPLCKEDACSTLLPKVMLISVDLNTESGEIQLPTSPSVATIDMAYNLIAARNQSNRINFAFQTGFGRAFVVDNNNFEGKCFGARYRCVAGYCTAQTRVSPSNIDFNRPTERKNSVCGREIAFLEGTHILSPLGRPTGLQHVAATRVENGNNQGMRGIIYRDSDQFVLVSSSLLVIGAYSDSDVTYYQHSLADPTNLEDCGARYTELETHQVGDDKRHQFHGAFKTLPCRGIKGDATAEECEQYIGPAVFIFRVSSSGDDTYQLLLSGNSPMTEASLVPFEEIEFPADSLYDRGLRGFSREGERCFMTRSGNNAHLSCIFGSGDNVTPILNVPLACMGKQCLASGVRPTAVRDLNGHWTAEDCACSPLIQGGSTDNDICADRQGPLGPDLVYATVQPGRAVAFAGDNTTDLSTAVKVGNATLQRGSAYVGVSAKPDDHVYCVYTPFRASTYSEGPQPDNAALGYCYSDRGQSCLSYYAQYANCEPCRATCGDNAPGECRTCFQQTHNCGYCQHLKDAVCKCHSVVLCAFDNC